MKNDVTIQINNLAALERLIGGDSELEVSLRQGVAAAMATKHLKAVVDHPRHWQVLADVKNSITAQARKAIDEEIGEIKKSTQYPYYEQVTLSETTKKTIQSLAQSEVSQLIRTLVTEALEQLDIQALVKAYVDSLVMTEIRAQFNQKMAAALTKV